jgi:hypothetical protein
MLATLNRALAEPDFMGTDSSFSDYTDRRKRHEDAPIRRAHIITHG